MKPSEKRTDKALVGLKAWFQWGDDTILATIDRLDSTYPDTAYSITWFKSENPTPAIFPDDCHEAYSVAHCAQLIRMET